MSFMAVVNICQLCKHIHRKSSHKRDLVQACRNITSSRILYGQEDQLSVSILLFIKYLYKNELHITLILYEVL